jgi:hypothetical protein
VKTVFPSIQAKIITLWARAEPWLPIKMIAVKKGMIKKNWVL